MDAASLVMTGAATESPEMHVEHPPIIAMNWHDASAGTTLRSGTNSSRIGIGR
jgi:hypothetical protein